MRLAISNIAWEASDDVAVAALLQRNGVDAIDIAPGKYFPDLAGATAGDIDRVRTWWANRGVEITGMQALLFGTTGLNVFGEEMGRDALLSHLASVARIAGRLGSPRLVFGSPRNRDRSGLSDRETLEMAVHFFRQLGDRAEEHGVFFCLEPNPECYGANFMTTSAETAEIVSSVDHPAIRMQFDTGALAINGEEPEAVLGSYSRLIGHIHASEPQLVTLGDGGVDHGRMARAVASHLPGQIVSIEMVASRVEPHVAAIARALELAILHYRTGTGGEGLV
jgi:D-psicose/D-tagatose/L-ribulose 3-epimerase